MVDETRSDSSAPRDDTSSLAPVTLTGPDGEEQTFVKCAESSGAYVWLEKESLIVIEREDRSYETAFADTYVEIDRSRSPWRSEDDEPRTWGWDIDPERCDDYVQELAEETGPDPIDEIRDAVCDHVTVEDSVSDGVWCLHTEIDGVDRPSLCREAIENLQSAGYVIHKVTEYYVRIKKEE